MTPERMAELRRWYSPGGNRGPASAPEMNETLDALAAAEATIAELRQLLSGLREGIGVTIAGLEHTSIGETPEAQGAIQQLIALCDVTREMQE